MTVHDTHGFPAEDLTFPGDDTSTPAPTSALLIAAVEHWTHDEISVGDLIDSLGDRAFGIIFLLLVLPTAVPGPPGLPVVFGVPLLFITAQLLFGRRTPSLPGVIRRRRLSRSALLRMLRLAKPRLARLEAVCRPRLPRLSGRRGERWIAGFFFLCTLFLVNPIPVPFSHLPLAFALVILALGFVERDGVVIIAGVVGALVGVVINVSLVCGVVVLGARFLHFV